jgi:ribosomal protein L5
MIKPCSQPLKINPFTSYRDPVTGKWIVVGTVQTDSQKDSTLKEKAESKLEKITSASPPVSLTKKGISFCFSSMKYPSKSAVNVSS